MFFSPGCAPSVSPLSFLLELDRVIMALASALSHACEPPAGTNRKVKGPQATEPMCGEQLCLTHGDSLGTHMHTHTHMYTHAHVHVHTTTQMHTHSHAYTHYTHAIYHTHTYTYSYTLVCTHKHSNTGTQPYLCTFTLTH